MKKTPQATPKKSRDLVAASFEIEPATKAEIIRLGAKEQRKFSAQMRWIANAYVTASQAKNPVAR